IASFVRSADERIAMRVLYPEAERRDLNALKHIDIVNAQGNLIKLAGIARISSGKGVNAVFHRDFKRAITITASIDDQYTTSEWVNQAILPDLEKLEQNRPGVQITAGGEWEETNESMRSLFQAFAFAL